MTRKVTRGIGQILARKNDKLHLGNLDSKRDWGHARDYVEAMWLMLQQDEPDDYVIATGVTKSVQDVVETAFRLVGLDWRKFVEANPAFVRRVELAEQRSDASKAARKLGWKPKIPFDELIREMLELDLMLEASSQASTS